MIVCNLGQSQVMHDYSFAVMIFISSCQIIFGSLTAEFGKRGSGTYSYGVGVGAVSSDRTSLKSKYFDHRPLDYRVQATLVQIRKEKKRKQSDNKTHEFK